MAAEKRFSLDKEHEMEDFRKCLSGISDNVEITLHINEFDERRPEFVLKGSLTKEELIKFAEERNNTLHIRSQKDELTGVLNNIYFEKRLNTVDRSEVLPVGIVNFNINDWKFVNDNFGDEESDRLIKIIADVIVSEAQPYYIIGRMDGDIFGVLIPRAEEGEAEKFVENVKDCLLGFDDYRLAPSAAAGIVYKTSIYESIEELMSDAEYNMFDDKYRMKNEPGYRERLEKGLSNG